MLGGMSNPVQSRNTTAFAVQAAISFGLSLVAVIVGIAYLPVNAWMRAFLVVGALYLVTSAFTLAKVVRDEHESKNVLSRVDQARLEKLLAEHDPYRA
jgi:hypothetical protein